MFPASSTGSLTFDQAARRSSGERRLGETKSAVVMETLNVSGMLQNHRLVQAIAEVGFHEFRRQMASKGQRYGCQIFLAPPFYPSRSDVRMAGTSQRKWT